MTIKTEWQLQKDGYFKVIKNTIFLDLK